LSEARRLAESAAAKQMNSDTAYTLAYVLEQQTQVTESERSYRQSLALRTNKTERSISDIRRGLIIVLDAQNKFVEREIAFKQMVTESQVGAYDFEGQGDSYIAQGKYLLAGNSFLSAATASKYFQQPRLWCRAAYAYWTADASDDALSNARTCIEKLGGNDDLKNLKALAHQVIADIFNSRSLFDEAAKHARESVALNPDDGWAHYQLGRALIELQRPLEAVTSLKQANKLTDGKYYDFHFALGSAYFKLEEWELARQSFEQSAQLAPKDTASAYNVALCYGRQRFWYDSARWYKEVLRRDPNHPDKAQIQRKIELLLK
jgi:tetratricopeptide (TPR) repeat protein